METVIDNFDYFGETNFNSEETTPEVSFSYDVLAEKCILGDYVLIVGPDVILSKALCDGSVDQFVKKSLKEKPMTHKNICESFADLEKRKMLDTVLSRNSIEPCLIKLIRSQCFNTIITTDYTPFLEKILNKQLGERQYTICNIYGDGIRAKSDISREDISPNEFNEVKPILFYAFGKAEYDNISTNGDIRRFAITDDDKIRIVTKWMGANGPLNFRQHVSQQRILAIGCRFDDWLFRFFWNMLRTNNSTSSEKEHRREDFVDDTDNQVLLRGEVAFDYIPEKSLEDYLKGKSVEVFKEDARDFMGKLVKAIEARKVIIKNEMETWKNNQLNHLSMGRGVFISYAHEDFWIVRRIYKQLISKNFKVWMDIRLEAGDGYDIRIKDAIKQCGVFMPILSSTTVKCFNSRTYKERYFYNVEWMEAESRSASEKNVHGQMEVLPVLLDSVSIDEKPLKDNLPSFITVKHMYDVTKEKIEVLTSRLDKMLNQ